MQDMDKLFRKLEKSKFRAGFRLGKKEGEYLTRKGIDTVIEEGEGFIRERLAPAKPENDGKQTPVKNHPFFIAQHATACCCRGCLSKWHKIAKGKPLTEPQIAYILEVIQIWLKKQAETENFIVRQKHLF